MSDSIDNLFVVDDEYLNNWETLKRAAEDVQYLWDTFIRMSRQKVSEEQAVVGNRADNFILFLDVADDILKQTIIESITDVANEMNQYIGDIDEADNVLY